MSTTNVDAASSAAQVNGASRPATAGLFWPSVILALLMIPAFVAQVFWARALFTPWYVPIGGTVAALAALVALRADRRWWRVAITLACVALAAFEWFFVTAGTVLPRYAGPVQVGSAIPSFQATLADGTPIDASYFQRDRPTALIFYQGRWCPFCMTQLSELNEHHGEFERLQADVVVVSIEDAETATLTQRDFPHLKVVSDEKRELATAVDVINPGFGPDGADSTAPTILLLDGTGTVRWFHRPTRFIARPSAGELVVSLEALQEGDGSVSSVPSK